MAKKKDKAEGESPPISDNPSSAQGNTPPPPGDNGTPTPNGEERKSTEQFSWLPFVSKRSDEEVIKAFTVFNRKIFEKYETSLRDYKVVALFDAEGVISRFNADRIYSALTNHPFAERDNVLLLLLSKGGSIEPAYQISKLCRAHTTGKFVVAVPREAKSAATLLAIGADEIHMGPLSHLGPIDPQLGGLPALGVVQALEMIAELAQRFPGSWEMLSRYLQRVLNVEQIGYCQRISESAMQYAERLLLTKPHISKEKATQIAQDLVYEYKDHGFVIDIEEARQHLGDSWVLTDTPEIEFASSVYGLYEQVDIALRFLKGKYLYLVGSAVDGFLIFDLDPQ